MCRTKHAELCRSRIKTTVLDDPVSMLYLFQIDTTDFCYYFFFHINPTAKKMYFESQSSHQGLVRM